MPSNNPLLSRVETDFPALTFTEGDDFVWQPNEATVYYHSDDAQFDAHLLHELSHAVLEHIEYTRDIDLIAMERDAWSYARLTLGPKYGIQIDSETIQSDMDTYRDWLHARSTCPDCTATGLQVKKSEYRCVSCLHSWRVNEARVCALRRYSTTN